MIPPVLVPLGFAEAAKRSVRHVQQLEKLVGVALRGAHGSFRRRLARRRRRRRGAARLRRAVRGRHHSARVEQVQNDALGDKLTHTSDRAWLLNALSHTDGARGSCTAVIS